MGYDGASVMQYRGGQRAGDTDGFRLVSVGRATAPNVHDEGRPESAKRPQHDRPSAGKTKRPPRQLGDGSPIEGTFDVWGGSLGGGPFAGMQTAVGAAAHAKADLRRRAMHIRRPGGPPSFATTVESCERTQLICTRW